MNKTYILILLVLLVMVMTTTSCFGNPSVGSMIDFGGHKWLVLDVQGSNALIISEQILEQRDYHGFYWEKCSLRSYLNGEYYNNKFTAEEKARIIETRNSNPPNPWYGTTGGAETIDKIFLLSLDEVVKYFGDSGDLKNKKRKKADEEKSTVDVDKGIYDIVTFESPDGHLLNDKYNQARIAKEADGKQWFWWLRSPGEDPSSAVIVLYDGEVNVEGFGVLDDDVGVRPALWIKI